MLKCCSLWSYDGRVAKADEFVSVLFKVASPQQQLACVLGCLLDCPRALLPTKAWVALDGLAKRISKNRGGSPEVVSFPPINASPYRVIEAVDNSSKRIGACKRRIVRALALRFACATPPGNVMPAEKNTVWWSACMCSLS